MNRLAGKMWLARAVLACAAAPLAAMAQVQVQPAPTSPVAEPAAAPATEERFQDWSIACEGPANGRYCTLVQELVRREDSRRMVRLEVKPEGPQKASAGLTLPLGLALGADAAWQIDDAKPGPRQGFSRCLPQGCLVPLVFDAAALAALQRGGALKVSAAVPTGEAVSFTLSLKGFGPAYARMLALAGTAGGDGASRTAP